MRRSGPEVDAITVEVIGNNLLAIAAEMGITLVRTGYSTDIKERRDCSAALLDLGGRTIAQAEHIPIHLGSMLGLVGEIRKRYSPTEIHPGDVFIANDPYCGGGTHLPDVTVAAPFFCEGRFVAFVADIAHHTDVGGSPAQPRDVYCEGLRIPPIKIVQLGHLRQDVLDFILLNWRLPEERHGDLRAQLAALHTGLTRLEALGARYGANTLLAAIEQLFDQSERQARAAIARIPSGRYEFVDSMDDDGVSDEPIPIRVAVTVAAGQLTCDFTGSAPQVKGNINVVSSALAATVYYAVKAAIDPTLPANGGYYRAIRIVAPEGSIVNCVPPAPVGFRTDTCQRIVDVIFGALAQAIPERMIAACHSTVCSLQFSGRNPGSGSFFKYSEVVAGGFGARPDRDGPDGVQVHVTNTSNLPVEALEAEYPILVERYELLPNSGGAGRSRGGLGLLRQYRIRANEARFRSKGDRHKTLPWGLLGGLPGHPGRLKLNPDTPQERAIGSKTYDLPLQQGDVVRVHAPGGGGYGDPALRDPAAVERDLREGKITREEAARVYGVFVGELHGNTRPG
ncbi:MAG: hydantoinase B/oxoprolinase family protein [Chloroflexi bacterium]|nr:hydantoinase B/oxoprolinase family protein [Chloroflexota bacterium]